MGKRTRIALALIAVGAVIGGLVIGSATAQPIQLTATLAGGGAGEDPDGSGTATVTLDAAARTVCFELTWAKIKGPFAAHIHVGAAGQVGDIAVHFFDMRDGTPLAGTIKGVSGCAKRVDAAVIQAILDDPAGYYVNVHNRRFPAGAIRGQLAGSASPTTTTTTPTSTATSTVTSTYTPPYP
jgi:hypothetical protein